MDERINKAIVRFVKMVQKKYPDLEKVHLFSSIVHGNFSEDSDIDLALIFKDLEDSKRFDFQVQLMLLASKIDNRLEPHPISREDFYSGNPFAVEIRRTGIEFSEESQK